MKQWEYKKIVLDLDEEPDLEILNNLGEQGWLLICSTPKLSVWTQGYSKEEFCKIKGTILIFRRKIKREIPYLNSRRMISL